VIVLARTSSNLTVSSKLLQELQFEVGLEEPPLLAAATQERLVTTEDFMYAALVIVFRMSK
jgi:hypothetical protein